MNQHIQSIIRGSDLMSDKESRVKAEETRLMDLFNGADQNKLDFIKKHVQQLAWVNISILDLQKQIDEEGAVIPYQNGKNQNGLQQNPACRLLVEYQKLSNTSFRALQPVLPEKRTGISKFEEWKREFDESFDCD